MFDDADGKTNVLLAMVVILLLGFAMYAAGPIIVPLLFGLFLAILVHPLVCIMGRRMPWGLAVAVVMLAITLVIVIAGVFFISSLRSLLANVPQYTARFKDEFTHLADLLHQRGLKVGMTDLKLEENISRAVRVAGMWLGSILAVVGKLLVSLVLMVFALLESRYFNRKVIMAWGPQRGEAILRSLDPLVRSVEQYLETKTIVSLVTGTVAYLVCLAIGIDYAFLWGVGVFVLNYLPYFGPWIAIVPPVSIAFLQFVSPTRGIVAFVALGIVQFASGNIFEPQLMGRSLKISPLFILASILFWGWYWGVAGVVLSIPLSVALVLSAGRVKKFKPIALFLRAGAPEAPVKNKQDC